MFDDSNITTPEQIQDVTLKEGQQVLIEPFMIKSINSNGNFTLESHRANDPGDTGYIRITDEDGQIISQIMNAYVMEFYVLGAVDRQETTMLMNSPASDTIVPSVHQRQAHTKNEMGLESANALDVATLQTSSAPSLRDTAEEHSSGQDDDERTTQSQLLESLSPTSTSSENGSDKNTAASRWGIETWDEAQSKIGITRPTILSILNKVFNIAKNEVYKFFEELAEGCTVGDADDGTEYDVEKDDVGKLAEAEDAHEEGDSDVGQSQQEANDSDVIGEHQMMSEGAVAEDSATTEVASQGLDSDSASLDSSATAAPQYKLADRGASFVVAASGVAAMEALEEAAWFANLQNTSNTGTETAVQTEEQAVHAANLLSAVEQQQSQHSDVTLGAAEAAEANTLASVEMVGDSSFDNKVETLASSSEAVELSEVLSWEVQSAAVSVPVTVQTVNVVSEGYRSVTENDDTTKTDIDHSVAALGASQAVVEEATEAHEMSLSMPVTEKAAEEITEGSSLIVGAHTQDELSAAAVEQVTSQATDTALSTSETGEEAATLTRDQSEVAASEHLAHDTPAPDLSVAVEREAQDSMLTTETKTESVVLTTGDSETAQNDNAYVIQHVQTMESAATELAQDLQPSETQVTDTVALVSTTTAAQESANGAENNSTDSSSLVISGDELSESYDLTVNDGAVGIANANLHVSTRGEEAASA